MLIGKRKLTLFSLVFHVLGLAIWWGGWFWYIRKNYYIEESGGEYTAVGYGLFAFFGMVIALFIIFKAIFTPPGQFRNFILVGAGCGALMLGSEALVLLAEHGVKLSETLMEFAKYLAGFGLANAISLMIEAVRDIKKEKIKLGG